MLVVIGILIALSINNWNENRKSENLERKYLTEIKSNLLSDLPDIKFNIEFNESRLKSNEIVLQYLNKEIPYSDSLKLHFGNLIFNTRTLPNMSAFESLKSRGVEIITNDSLRKNITTLYSFTFQNIVGFENLDDHPFQYQLFIPTVSKALNIITVWENASPINQLQLLENYQLKNVITINILIRQHMLSYYYDLNKEINKTISDIDTELNN